MGAADPGALVSSLRTGLAHGGMTLNIVHTEASTGWGGQELRILTEMAGMARRGHRLHLVAPPDAQIVTAARARGLSVDTLPIEWKRLPGLVAMRRWLARHHGKIDVVNAHSSTDAWLAAVALATLPRAPGLVRTRHLSTPVNRLATTRWLYQRATSHIVVTGEALKSRLVRYNRYDPATITSVRTGIDLARFRPRDRDEACAQCGVDARPAVGIVATLRDWKGHDYLLDAWRELKTRVPGWQLLIIGDGPRRAHLERRVHELDIGADVRFVGNQEDVPAWLACLDIAVLPSYGDEGVPQSLMQAAACGLPAVSTPVGAIAEAVVDGETGLLVSPRDPRALAQALATLMNDRALRERMGRAAHAYAQSHFGIDAMLDAMEAIFTRAATRTR
jgi:glycosyltransferase involved in cell wall biosynthesis